MHQLPLLVMLATLLALSAATAFAIVVAANVAPRRAGKALDAPLPLRESVVGAGATL
jgi:hypothetical protein